MYVGTYLDNKNSILKVAERIGGQRLLTEYPLILEYYVQDNDGYYDGYDGQKLKKITCPNVYTYNQHKKENKSAGIKTYELGFNLVNKVLYNRYGAGDTPTLHKSFIDIEVDRDGFEYLTVKQLVDKACCPINAVSIYNNWEDTLYTLMLKPDNISFEDAQTICDKFENTFLFKDEKQLLESIIVILNDTDVCAGWNSTLFDYPYIVRRIENVLGKTSSKALCLWGLEPLYKEKVGQFGDKNVTYEFYGKWFCDYLELYKKHERGKKESYKLDSIGELELGERKVQHDESLEDMYRNRYEDFIKYNRQDTMIVKKLEDKLKYIDIHNEQAHDIRCTFEQTMGTVAWVDQSFINEAHDMNLMVLDKIDGKNSEFDGITPPGAFVPTPVTGIHQHIMSYDMASLYPTSTRSLNMSPETIVGHLKFTHTKPFLFNKIEENELYRNKGDKTPDWGATWADVWGTVEYEEIMNQTDTILELQIENGPVVQRTAKDIYNMIFNDNSNLCISPCGVIFRTDKIGLINKVFTRWYAERKKFKKEMNKYESMAEGVKITDDELLNELR